MKINAFYDYHTGAVCCRTTRGLNWELSAKKLNTNKSTFGENLISHRRYLRQIFPSVDYTTSDGESYVRTDDESYTRTEDDETELYDNHPKVGSI